MTKFRCPLCGEQLSVQPARSDSGGLEGHGALRPFEYSLPGQGRRMKSDVPVEFVRKTPTHPAGIESDVRVPLFQAVITGLMAGALLVVLGLGLGWGLTWQTPAVVAMVSAFACWMLFLFDHRSLLRQVERVIMADIDGDGRVGEPEPETVRVEVQEGERRWVFADLPVDLERLRLFARGALSGKPLAQASWTGRGGVFSRGEYQRLLDEMLARGFAVWRNPAAHAQGLDLTGVGRAVLRRLAESNEIK